MTMVLSMQLNVLNTGFLVNYWFCLISRYIDLNKCLLLSFIRYIRTS